MLRDFVKFLRTTLVILLAILHIFLYTRATNLPKFANSTRLSLPITREKCAAHARAGKPDREWFYATPAIARRFIYSTVMKHVFHG